MHYEFTASKNDEGMPCYKVLIKEHGFSSELCKKVRLYGSLSVNGKFRRMKDPLKAGEFVRVSYFADGEIPPGEVLLPLPEIPLLFQDQYLIVCEKKAGLLTHPSRIGAGNSVQTMLSTYNLHPVNRLDRDTSGLLIFAKSGLAHYKMVNTEINKNYLGFIWSAFENDEGEICLPIGRKEGSIIEREVRNDGKYSLTIYKTLEKYRSANGNCFASKVKFHLITGRTHQIRVHSSATGHPLIGDTLYPPSEKLFSKLISSLDDYEKKHISEAASMLGHQALHAHELSFKHPFTGEEIEIKSPLPADLLSLEKLLSEIGGSQHFFSKLN